MQLLNAGGFPFLLLDGVHQLLNFGLKTLLKFFLHFSVFLELYRCRSDCNLQSLTSAFTLENKIPIFRDVFLKIIKNLKLVVERDQSVQLVLKLNFFFFELQLQLRVVSLLQHSCCVAGICILSLRT